VRHKHTIIVGLAVYLLVSFVPQLGLMALLGKGKGMTGAS
jgi:hypothetical protein